ncbi:MAG TPA: DUF4157 domain-containing protein [Gaiellaceae bacterium]
MGTRLEPTKAPAQAKPVRAAPPQHAPIEIGRADDPAEHEAERVAAQLLRMPDTLEPGHSAEAAGGAAPRIVHDVLSQPGHPLDAASRAFFEPRLGRDLSNVRIHDDSRAAQSAQAVNACAYAIGDHVAFAAGRFSADTGEGRRALAHELVHVAQQRGTNSPAASSLETLRRQPSSSKARVPVKKATPDWEIHLRPKPNEIEIDFSDLVFEDEVVPVLFKAGKLPASLTLSGGPVSTRWVLAGPSGQDFSPVSSLFDKGFANRLADEHSKQQVLEEKQSTDLNEASVRDARARFRKRHDGHSLTVLKNIDTALERVTKNNPNLLIAYYDYYTHNKLTDDLDEKRKLGETTSGDTDLNPRVLGLDPVFKTSDPLSLLGGTLIHEYAHTPQGGKGTIVEQAPQEAKAYGIELFLSERMGDDKRAEFISDRYAKNDPVDRNTGSDKIFRATYNAMRALYKVIDSGRTQSDARIAGGISAEDARRMSVEFISTNEEDYGTALRTFISNVPR